MHQCHWYLFYMIYAYGLERYLIWFLFFGSDTSWLVILIWLMWVLHLGIVISLLIIVVSWRFITYKETYIEVATVWTIFRSMFMVENLSHILELSKVPALFSFYSSLPSWLPTGMWDGMWVWNTSGCIFQNKRGENERRIDWYVAIWCKSKWMQFQT